MADRPERVGIYRRIERFPYAADEHRDGLDLAEALHDAGNTWRKQSATRQIGRYVR